MTSQEPADDASPRRRPATQDPPQEQPATPDQASDKPQDRQQDKPQDRQQDQEWRRPPIGEPVDPYADPYDGAGPYTVPAPADPFGPEPGGPEGPYGPFDGTLIINEPYRSKGEPLRTEQERLDQYRREQDAEALPKPPPGVMGYYPHEQKVPSHPTDSVRQFSSYGGTPPRRRRSDWPVLVFALVVTSAVTLGCCLAGFALFSAWNPFTE